MKRKLTTLAAGLFLTMAVFGQTSGPVKDYLGLAKPILFDNVPYNLSWSAHPSASYYKQEYLARNDNIDKFKRLVSIDLLVGQVNLKDIVADKIAELNNLKATNPIINHQTFSKDDEIMLDFLISQNAADGKQVNIVERNVYRYKMIKVKNGQEALLLFAVSDRAYGNDIDTFLSNLKNNKQNLLNAVGAFTLPEIKLAK